MSGILQDELILDLDLLNEVVGAIGIESMAPLLSMFMTQAPILAEGVLAEGVGIEDRKDAAHSLKGMARQLGLNRLAAACAVCEESLKSGSGNEASAYPLAVLVAEAVQALATALATHSVKH